MKELHNKHNDAIYYHPVTMMAYKNTSYGFKFFTGIKFHAFAENGEIEIWKPSGMKKGFILVK